MLEVVKIINDAGILSSVLVMLIVIISGYVKGWWVPRGRYDDVVETAKKWETLTHHWERNAQKAVQVADKVARFAESRVRATRPLSHVRPKFRIHEGRGWPYDELYGLLEGPAATEPAAETEMFDGEVRE